ncbi:hypothetical protein CPB83DRAFT_850622 [Crepidotus variabilis]|uniref:Yeast cell wall synthesis Kre9/Knh1-like N-terminal domain-containing protein n=1 Tax=Crepidotus variabilis TaxID=179855 RepID=A0A9P6EKN8_9AGAR|nr:hypothetical protein CPB83DRAFT_850622 [Crepidotus variabilis]
MFSKSLVVLASVSVAFAVPFITNPISTTHFTCGQQAEIKWQDSGSEPGLDKYGPCKISIYAGNAQQQTSLQLISDNTDVSKVSSIQFTPDCSVGPTGGEYFIRVESLALKDGSPQNYPAMAFSSKFNLDNMNGKFSAAVQAQIDGQTTAPLATPTQTGSASGAASSASTTKAPTSASSAAASTSKKPSASASNAASPLSASAGWAGALLSALVGVTLF